MKQEFRFSNVLICIFCCLIFVGDASSKNPVDEATLLFQNKQYKEALDIWYDLVRSGNAGGGIYYNIGVSESLLGQTPKAVMAYEKALRFRPSDIKLNEALERERKKIENAVNPVPGFFLTKWIQNVLALLRPGYWAIIGLILFLVLIVWITTYNRKVLKNSDRVGMQISILLTTAIFCFVCSWLSYRQLYRKDEAIIITECDFRQAPTEDSPQIRAISPGEKVIVADQIGNWYKVRLLNLDEGWVKSGSLDFILVDQD